MNMTLHAWTWNREGKWESKVREKEERNRQEKKQNYKYKYGDSRRDFLARCLSLWDGVEGK